jgi:rubrerythrin
MSKRKIKKIYECKKCGHKWINRKEDIRQCPYCKSAYWDKPKDEETECQDQIKRD